MRENECAASTKTVNAILCFCGVKFSKLTGASSPN